jgi:hypothetical protein
MIELEARDDQGRTIRARGPTRAAAEAVLKARIRRLTGARFVAKHGPDEMEFETFAEVLPPGDYERVCIRTEDGRIVCGTPACTCEEPSHCSCGSAYTSFSESRGSKMRPPAYTPPRGRRRYQEENGQVAPQGNEPDIGNPTSDLYGKVMDAVKNADTDTLTRLADLLGIDAEGFKEVAEDPTLAQGATDNLIVPPDAQSGYMRERPRRPARLLAEGNGGDLTDEERIDRFCELQLFRDIPQPEKFAEHPSRASYVQHIINKWRASGQTLRQYFGRDI